MQRILFCLLFLCTALTSNAQLHTLNGMVYDDKGAPVQYATVALLETADSTLAFFAITDNNGAFAIKSVKEDTYRLQISFIRYNTYDTLFTVPAPSGDQLGIFVLRSAAVGLDAVQVTAERIPIQINGDTVQYNADSYKTAPDASAEDLLKKLPGVEVDASGNIKAQGEEVQQVLVDGKEFFSSDPTVATKNLPADAIDKVQVFDKTSEEADFTGVDDGARTKTINLVLKEGKKSMWLGSVQAGYGTDDRYQFNAKTYRFTKTNQIAALGMMNNVNQFGFSINDYIDFNGGFGNMMRGGGFRINTSSDMPVDFGQSVDGRITSGAAGLNYTFEPNDDLRFNVSYLGNGYDRDLQQNAQSINYAPTGDFSTNDSLYELTRQYFHRLNLNFKAKPDSVRSIIVTGNTSLNYGNVTSNGYTASLFDTILSNRLNSAAYEESNNLEGTINANYIRKTNSALKYWKLNAYANGGTALDATEWSNLTEYFDPVGSILDESYRNDDSYDLSGTVSLSALIKIPLGLYLQPSIAGGIENEQLLREQGPLDAETIIDSLSPDVQRHNYHITPGLTLKRNTDKTQFGIGLQAEMLNMENTINGTTNPAATYWYLLPDLMFEHEIKRGYRFGFDYNATVNAPTVSQLNPVTDYSNSLSLFAGNPNLKPEYTHAVSGRFMLFDQFSFTSLFTRINLNYTLDKINYSKTINPDLSQSYTLVNVKDDINAGWNLHFNTPIRPLKVNVGISLDETYNQGINLVNGVENTIQSFTHSGELSFDNRKKDIIDARIGGGLSYTRSVYSINTDQNVDYINQSLFADISITPDSLWRIEIDGDLQAYRLIDNPEVTIVPLLHAELSRYILKNNRGTITLKAYDILNRNTGITQTAAYNYLSVQESNAMNRYFMLSFKYRINKQDQQNAIDVKIN